MTWVEQEDGSIVQEVPGGYIFMSAATRRNIAERMAKGLESTPEAAALEEAIAARLTPAVRTAHQISKALRRQKATSEVRL